MFSTKSNADAAPSSSDRAEEAKGNSNADEQPATLKRGRNQSGSMDAGLGEAPPKVAKPEEIKPIPSKLEPDGDSDGGDQSNVGANGILRLEYYDSEEEVFRSFDASTKMSKRKIKAVARQIATALNINTKDMNGTASWTYRMLFHADDAKIFRESVRVLQHGARLPLVSDHPMSTTITSVYTPHSSSTQSLVRCVPATTCKKRHRGPA